MAAGLLSSIRSTCAGFFTAVNKMMFTQENTSAVDHQWSGYVNTQQNGDAVSGIQPASNWIEPQQFITGQVTFPYYQPSQDYYSDTLTNPNPMSNLNYDDAPAPHLRNNLFTDDQTSQFQAQCQFWNELQQWKEESVGSLHLSDLNQPETHWNQNESFEAFVPASQHIYQTPYYNQQNSVPSTLGTSNPGGYNDPAAVSHMNGNDVRQISVDQFSY